MRGKRIASGLVALLLAPLMVVVTADPASANSLMGVAQPGNAWIAAELSGIAEASAAAGTLPATATMGAPTAAGVATKVGTVAGGTGVMAKVNGALNVGAILLTVGGLAPWSFGKSDAPDTTLPGPSGGLSTWAGTAVRVETPGTTPRMRWGYTFPAYDPSKHNLGSGMNYFLSQRWDGPTASWTNFSLGNGWRTPGETKTTESACNPALEWDAVVYPVSGVAPTAGAHMPCNLRLRINIANPGGSTYSTIHEGIVGYTAPTTGSMPRTIEQTVTCKRPDGSTHTITSSHPFTLDGLASPGAEFTNAVAGLNCPSGELATNADVNITTPGVAGTVPLTPTLTPPADLVSDMPVECLSGAPCAYDLTYPQPGVSPVTSTTPRVSCFNGSDACAEWWTDPNKNETFKCRYGKGTVWVDRPLNNCAIYRDIFDPDTTVRVPVYDPPGPTDDGPCSFGWGDVLNGGIVLKAVKCALTWAFVPSSGFFQGLQGRFGAAWAGTAPAAALAALGAWTAPFYDIDTSGAFCAGPELSITLPGGHALLDNSHPFATCSGLSQWFAEWFRVLLGAMAIFGTITIGSRMLVSSFWIGAVFPGDNDRRQSSGD